MEPAVAHVAGRRRRTQRPGPDGVGRVHDNQPDLDRHAAHGDQCDRLLGLLLLGERQRASNLDDEHVDVHQHVDEHEHQLEHHHYDQHDLGIRLRSAGCIVPVRVLQHGGGKLVDARLRQHRTGFWRRRLAHGQFWLCVVRSDRGPVALLCGGSLRADWRCGSAEHRRLPSRGVVRQFLDGLHTDRRDHIGRGRLAGWGTGRVPCCVRKHVGHDSRRPPRSHYRRQRPLRASKRGCVRETRLRGHSKLRRDLRGLHL